LLRPYRADTASRILVDEIKRAPASLPRALLEAMSDRQVTLGAETRRLPDPSRARSPARSGSPRVQNFIRARCTRSEHFSVLA
jgi:MoxR-like ATPase